MNNKNYSLADFGVTKHEFFLENGLKVIFIEKPFAPIYGKIIMGAGSVFNPSDNGLAHMTEHLLMNGSRNKTKEEFYGILESIGAFRNAFTAKEWMSVNTEVAEVEHLVNMRDFFAEALQSIYVTEDMLSKEKEVIFSELQKERSKPHYDSGEKIRKLLAQETPWSYSNLGTAEGIRSLALNDIQNFFSTYCVVENSALIIAGGCTVSDIQKAFSNINFLHGNKAVLPESPKLIVPSQRMFYEISQPQTDVIISFNGPTPGSRESYILAFVMSLVHDGMTSRFYKKIRTEKALAYSISNIAFNFNEVRYIGTEIGVPTHKTDLAIEALLEVYSDLLKTEIDSKEIADKLTTWWFSAKRNNERALDWVEKFDDCLFPEENPVVGDFPDIYNFRKTITPDDIQQVIHKYIKLDEYHLCIFGKEGSKKFF